MLLIDPHIVTIMRRRFLAGAPFTVLLGLVVGAIMVRSAGMPFSTMALTAIALPAIAYVILLTHGVILQATGLDPEGAGSDFVGLGLDALAGGMVGNLVAPFLGVSSLQAISAGSAILCIQTLIVEKLVLGEGFGEALNWFLFPSSSHPTASGARAEALAALGNYDAAQQEYERQIAKYPADVQIRLALARMLRLTANRPQAAADVLRQILQLRKLDLATETAATRELSDLLINRLQQPRKAALLLLRYVQRHPTDPAAAWATHRLNELKSQQPGSPAAQ